MASYANFAEYHQWVSIEKKKHQGIYFDETGQPKPTDYIPLEVLKQYWDHERVKLFLTPTGSCRPATSLPVADVIQGYLRIFSTLVYISTADRSLIHYLDQFAEQSCDDGRLPFRQKADLDRIFAGPSEVSCGVRDMFQHQFLFNPLRLADAARMKLHHTRLASEEVLPMLFERNINPFSRRDGSAAELKHFTLAQSSGLTDRVGTLVAKIFPPNELEFSFKNELEAYSSLNQVGRAQNLSKYFLNYYGSFVQNGRGIILLEYADQGSLLEFFKHASQPYEREELFDMWRSLHNLCLGLAELHNLDERKTTSLRGIHQDLNPSNIFVFSDEDRAKNRFRFKIGDFGLSSFKLYEAMKKDSRMPDNKSTKMYSAPELTLWHYELDHIDSGVTAAVDMWSLGCVFFQIAVWTICGQRGLDEFLLAREAETLKCAPACASSFHNGEERLQAVEDMAEKLYRRRRCFDVLTHRLCRWLCNSLLLAGREHRLSASQAAYHLESVINNAERVPDLVYPSDYDFTSVDATNTRDSNYASTPPQNSAYYPDHNERMMSQTKISPPRGLSPRSSLTRHSLHSMSSYQSADETGQSAVVGSRDDRGSELEASNATKEAEYETWMLRKSTQSIRTSDSSTYASGSASSSNMPNTWRRRTSNDLDTPRAHNWNSHPVARIEGLTKETGGFGPAAAPSFANYEGPLRQTVALNSTARQRSDRELTKSTPLEQHMDVPQPSPTPTLSSAGTVRPSATADVVTVKDLLQWRKGKKKRSINELPGELQDIPGILKGRDQVFLIDDSASMTRHWKDVRNVVEALGCVVKNVDPDGMDLRFTSRSADAHKGLKTTADLLHKIDSHAPRPRSQCFMETALSTLIDDLIPLPSIATRSTGTGFGTLRNLLGRPASPSKTGISVYILTNGIWTGTNSSYSKPGINHGSSNPVHVCGVDKSIHTLVERLRESRYNHSYVTLQFIRFGRDKVGKARLRYLDNEMEKTAEWDIVDRRYHKNDVRAMLIGALAEQDYPSDDSEDEESSPSGSSG